MKNLKKICFVNCSMFLHFFKVVFLLIVMAGINHSRHKITERYQYPMDEYSQTGLLIDQNKLAIDDLNIPKNAKVILAPEPSQNGPDYKG